MSGVPVPIALAGRFSVSPLQPRKGVVGRGRLVAVLPVRSPNFGHGGNRFPRYAEAVEDVVPGHVVRDEPEERSQAVTTQPTTYAASVAPSERPTEEPQQVATT